MMKEMPCCFRASAILMVVVGFSRAGGSGDNHHPDGVFSF